MTESALYLDHFELSRSPFLQEPDPDIFFQETDRLAVLQSLEQDIGEGKPLVKLTGNEGVGKTFLNLVLVRRLPPETYDIIRLDHPVGSFEDLLRIICLALDQDVGDNSAPRKYVQIFRELLTQRRNRGKKVLLIIDEAEKIFLATLERLVKMICDTEEGVLQVLLIGRTELDYNLEQLRIYCSNVGIHAGYILEPLNFPETGKYLQYRLNTAGIPGTRHLDVFSEAAVSAIYDAAGGNISLTNALAEKGLINACSMGMARVEPELIGLRQARSLPDTSVLARFLDLILRNKWWAAAAVLLALAVVAVFPAKEKENAVPETGEQFSIEDFIIEKPLLPTPAEKDPAADEGRAAPGKLPPPSGAEVEKVFPGVAGKQETVRPGDRKQGTSSREETAPPAAVRPPEADTPPAAAAETGGPTDQGVTGSPGDAAEPAAAAPVIIRADGRKRKGPDDQEQPKQEGETATADAAALFQERLRASSNWLAWAYRGGYTIQLMMLTADDAEENLKNILIQEEYSAVRDDMYIIRRNSPPALFVFYGMYNTLREARQERDNLPSVLQGHQPYALSIQEALEKSEE